MGVIRVVEDQEVVTSTAIDGVLAVTGGDGVVAVTGVDGVVVADDAVIGGEISEENGVVAGAGCEVGEEFEVTDIGDAVIR